MNKSILTAVITATLVAGTLSAVGDAGARERSRNVQRSAHEGSVSKHRDNARFESDRQREWQRDGEGNATGSTSRSITGANGGSAEREGSSYRNADGSAGREGSTTATNANGGTMQTSGGSTRDAEGNVSGSRSTTATGANGGTYEGSTSWSDGQVTHTGTVTGANGGTVEVNRERGQDAEGNPEASRSTTATGPNGGTYTGSTTLSDGQLTHTGSATGPNGGTAQVDGSYSRGDDGKLDGSRDATMTGPNGRTYTGSTTVDGGTVTHTGICTNTAGETVDCPNPGADADGN